MERIDVIMLANNIDDKHYNLSRVTIDSLRKTSGDVQFNVIIIESNKDSEYSFEGCTIIKPNLEFNYAEFVNIGYRECHNEWIMIINNDLEFTPNWFDEVLDVYKKNNGIESFSFYEPDYHGKYFSSMFNDSEDVYEGYEVGPRISGWCILHRRSVLNKIKRWDNRFPFYYVDDDYGQSIKSMGIRNAMLKKSIVYHRVSQSHDTIPNMVNENAAKFARERYENKWFNKPPVLSVIIPAYNFQNYIVECVKSVTTQITDFNFEILIRDDYSRDDTNKLLREEFGSDPRVVIFDSSDNLGAYGNIKLLLEYSRGKYVTILDGDDYLNNPHKFQMQVNFLNQNPDYVMHSTGYVSLLPDGSIDPPEPGHNRFPKETEVSTKDLLESNIVSFGRMFRNIPGIVKDWMEDFPYLDWAFNYEISLHGKIRCDNWNCGVYRHNPQGMFSLKSEEDKQRNNSRGIEIIKRREDLRKMKTISIIDCFVHDKKVEYNLIKSIKRLKENGHDIFLISNTPIEKGIIELVDYHLYDKRNQLFKKEYPGVTDVDFWYDQGNFVVHNMKSGLQKHGLSVMINLFNALDIAKGLGYTHFQRFETDDLYGDESMKWVSKIPERVLLENKKGLFYLNDYNIPSDASFHYFFCEIDYFLKIMPKISCEEDYERYLLDIQGSRDFRIVEVYIYDNIKKCNQDLLVIREGGEEMRKDFPDTIWNTVVSASNLSNKYKGCITDLYRVIDKSGNPEGYCLYSHNYLDQDITRRIVVHTEGASEFDIHHKLTGRNSWWLNNLIGTPYRIDVYQEDEFLYSHSREENGNSYIQSNS